MAIAALAPIEAPLALESILISVSFSMEGHCGPPRQGEVRREADYNIAETIIDEKDGQWLERIVLECHALKKSPITPREAYERHQSDEESQCPSQSEWSVLLDEPHRLMFEQRRGPCGDEPARLVLGLAVHGREDRWMVTYGAREPVRNPADRQVFLDILEAAEVVTKVSPTAGFPVWGAASGPAWVAKLIRDHEWSYGHDVVGPIPIPSGWALTQRMHDLRFWMWLSAFTPPGQGFDTADEALVLIAALNEWADVQQRVEDARADLKKRCGSKAQLNVLLREQDRIVTEAVASGCRKAQYEYRLTTYLAGKENVFQSEYLARKAPDPVALHDIWAPRMLAIGLRRGAQDSAQ